MKKFYLSFIITLIISPLTFSQWFPQNSSTTENLIKVNFVSQNIGWMASGYKIFKSTDGGNTWFLQTVISPEFMTSFFFLNENIGWYTTHTGFVDSRIYKTTNGGDSWQLQYYGQNQFLEEIEFTNTDLGFCVGSGGTPPLPWVSLSLKTTDGGNSWEQSVVSPSYYNGFYSVHFLNEFQGWFGGVGVLFKTSDGGENWTELPFILNNTALLKIQFLNSDIGWVKTDFGGLYKTIDGGVSWVEQAQSVTSFYFTSEQIGWYAQSNNIYNTTDGGKSWTMQNSNTVNQLSDFDFIDSNNGWAVGDNGTVLYTPNGGTPVKLVSFTADVVSNDVLLSWITATETNNQGFEILRTNQNEKANWVTIGFVKGQGTTTEHKQYSFIDESLNSGKYKYRLKQIDYDGTFEFSQIVEVNLEVANGFFLGQNYPNPFNATTIIKYILPTESNVKVYILNPVGELVDILYENLQGGGQYELMWNAEGKSSGIYLLIMETISKDNSSDFRSVRKALLIK